MVIKKYCTCGGEMQFSGPPSYDLEVKKLWELMHSGPNHQDTDKRTCRKAQIKNDMLIDQEEGATP